MINISPSKGINRHIGSPLDSLHKICNVHLAVVHGLQLVNNSDEECFEHPVFRQFFLQVFYLLVLLFISLGE